jgi:MFS family permease
VGFHYNTGFPNYGGGTEHINPVHWTAHHNIRTSLMPTLWLLLIPVVIFGIGHGMSVPSIQTLLAELAPIQYSGAFMSINGMALRLEQTLAPVFMGVIFAIWGMGGIFYVGAWFSSAMFILSS